MAIDLNNGYRELLPHVRHEVVVVAYGHPDDTEPDNVAIECETCGSVLIDFDHPKGGHLQVAAPEPEYEWVALTFDPEAVGGSLEADFVIWGPYPTSDEAATRGEEIATMNGVDYEVFALETGAKKNA